MIISEKQEKNSQKYINSINNKQFLKMFSLKLLAS